MLSFSSQSLKEDDLIPEAPAIKDLDELYVNIEDLSYYSNETLAIRIKQFLMSQESEFFQKLNKKESEAIEQGAPSLCHIMFEKQRFDLEFIDFALSRLTNDTLDRAQPPQFYTCSSPLAMAVYGLVNLSAKMGYDIVLKLLDRGIHQEKGYIMGSPLAMYCLSSFHKTSMSPIILTLAMNLIGQLQDVNIKHLYTDATCLHIAARQGLVNFVRILLEKGAKTSLTATDGILGGFKETPLDLATKSGSRECVELLLREGASPHIAPQKISISPLYNKFPGFVAESPYQIASANQSKGILSLFEEYDKNCSVSEDELNLASSYFRENPNSLKMRKKEHNLNHSFLRFGSTIYAIVGLLGKGRTSKVKLIEDGKAQRAKINIRRERDASAFPINAGVDILKHLGRYIGEIKVDGKCYIASKFIQGSTIFEMKHSLNEEQRFNVTIACLNKLDQLHKSGVVHQSITESNIIIYNNGDHFDADYIDFDTSSVAGDSISKIRDLSSLHDIIKSLLPELFKDKINIECYSENIPSLIEELTLKKTSTSETAHKSAISEVDGIIYHESIKKPKYK